MRHASCRSRPSQDAFTYLRFDAVILAGRILGGRILGGRILGGRAILNGRTPVESGDTNSSQLILVLSFTPYYVIAARKKG